MSNDPNRPFAGKRRNRTTRRSVCIADTVSRWVITLGGIGTIVAVMTVCLFLVWVVIPLFVPESLTAHAPITIGHTTGREDNAVDADSVLFLEDDGLIGCRAFRDGVVQCLSLIDGKLLSSRKLLDESPTAWSTNRDGQIVFGLPGPKVRRGKIGFESVAIAVADLPDDLRQQLSKNPVLSTTDGVVERTANGEYRRHQLVVKLEDPLAIKSSESVQLIAQASTGDSELIAYLLGDGELRIGRVTKTKNLLTSKLTTKLTEGKIQTESADEIRGGAAGKPTHLLIGGIGENVYIAWENGKLLRFNTQELTNPVLAEKVDVLVDPDAKLTALTMLVGRSSLVVGDSTGGVSVWFCTKPDNTTTPDGAVLTMAHQMPRSNQAVSRLDVSSRARLLTATYDNGETRLYHVTSSQWLATGKIASGKPAAAALTLSPKDDAVFAIADGRLWKWDVHAEHPETTVASLFLPVWYEGYSGPEAVWQSSSGTDEFEPKYGLFPLIFGTLKATFYTMLLGAPIALLSAIYSSEFIKRSTKSRVKPVIEMMASLPSVVLGFIAGNIAAPIVEDIVPHLLTCFISVPFAFLLGAHLWQLIPGRAGAMFARKYRLLGVAVAMPCGIMMGVWLAPYVERFLFAGDVKAWLDRQIGTGTGAWMMLLLPASVLVALLTCTTYVNPWMRRIAGGWSRGAFALLDLGKFLLATGATLLFAYMVSWLLTSLGIDPRGTFVSTYAQRNAFIVGCAMGFAVIPIIYTISDDALSAVPDALRAGSLGAGATPWQTAVRVVIPTAMSGLFSAMMVGLGRAVGETMIVVMSAGNTPTMGLNVFDGFRTLSANIATEIGEATQDTTHYRTLFLAALCLFAITFSINTFAEFVRQRFRKRTFQL